MQWYPLRTVENPFTSPHPSKQIPQQQGFTAFYLKELEESMRSSRSQHDTSKLDSNRSSSASFKDTKVVKEKVKDLPRSILEVNQTNRNARSISPIKQSDRDNEKSKVKSRIQENITGDNTPPTNRSPHRIEHKDTQKDDRLHQKGKNVKEDNTGQTKKNKSFSWNEEEEDTRREGSTILEEDSLREDEIREKLLQLQEDIIKKQKLKGRTVNKSNQVDSSSFFNDTQLLIGKSSVSPHSLTKILTSLDSNFSTQEYGSKMTPKDFKRKNKSGSISILPKRDKSVDLSIDTNENYAKIVHLGSNMSTLEGRKDYSLRRSSTSGLSSNGQSSMLLGCTKLQLFFHKMRFRNINAGFKPLKEKTTFRETIRGGDLTRREGRETSFYDAPVSFRTCVSFVSERHANIHLGGVMVKNILNKRLQAAFFALKSVLSFHQLQYNASIVSGAIVLSKLFRAHERSLLLQCVGLWKLRDALQLQRDQELAAKDNEIKRLALEKNRALTSLAEEKEKRSLSPIRNQENKPVGETKKPVPIANKENAVEVPNVQNKPVEKKPIVNENPFTMAKKNVNTLDESRLANLLLYEQLKALYDKKCAEEQEANESKPLRALNDNTPYQKPFKLGQPSVSKRGSVQSMKLSSVKENSMESDERSSRTIESSSKRSSVASSAYSSYGIDSYPGVGGNKKDVNKFWAL